MMKKTIFPFFLVFVIAVAGCVFNPSSQKKSDIDVFTGTDGLTAEFAKNAPPQTVFEDSSFPVLLRIGNKGAYSIRESQQGVLSIGVEKDYVNDLRLEGQGRVAAGKDNVVYFFVDGKSAISPNGDEVVASFNAKAGRLDPQSEAKPSVVTATLCYPYQTILSTTVCIDTDVAGARQGKKACNAQELSFSSGQGAPIAVTKIEPQMVPDENEIKPQFLIFIENKGRGTPVNIAGYDSACYKSDYSNLWNSATVKVYTSGKGAESQLSCTPSLKSPEGVVDESTGFLKFRDNKDFVRCTFKKSVSRDVEAYASTLKVVIDYGYVQSIAANFFIEKPNKR